MRGVLGFEWQHVDAQTQKSVEQMLAMAAPIALGESVSHFKQSDDR